MRKAIQQQFELVSSLVKRDLKTRYKDSVLGFFWSFVKPAFLTLILWAVFSTILELKFPHEIVPYWLFVLISVISWNYFIGSLFDATGSVVANGNLLKKVKINCEAFPIASVLANLVHYLLAMGIVVLVIFATIGFPRYIWFLPIMIGIETLLIIGLSFYLSALNVFYRDISGALELLSMAWFYVTPVVYPLQVAQERIDRTMGKFWFHAYLMNPITPIIGAIRRVSIFGKKQGEISAELLVSYLAVSLIVSIVLFFSGWIVFRRLSRRFADEL